MAFETVPHFPLRKGRAHEVSGPGAYVFAFSLAALTGGQVLLVRESWRPDQVHPPGLSGFFDPRGLLFAAAKDQTEVLAVAEDALRSGAVPLVVAELSKPLTLTTGRRLQLAASEGGAIALAVIPEGMGSNAAETRWHCAPVFDPAGSTLHCWKLIKNKSGTLGAWHVRWDAAARRIIVVSPARQRPGAEGAPG
ncbi:ImuA family protein [Roseobacteraceae bacterium NS-SX3]